ncbi:MAG: DUF1365 domain-containing protein [Isosphaeraceae bacterium]
MQHRFRYRLYMSFIDLDEVPSLMSAGLLSGRRFSSNAFLRTDHFGDPDQPMGESVRDLIRHETGLATEGPIRVLTQLRHFGHYFSPLNLFFCYDRGRGGLQAVVAEVQNTPWHERHCYVLWRGNRVGTGEEAEYRHPKSFHVSPFMSMDVDYRWRLNVPAERVRVGIDNTSGDVPLFRATMALDRVPLTRRAQWALHGRYPLITARITTAIYLQAFRLWRKKCPFYPHPGRLAGPACQPAPANRNGLGSSPDSAEGG